MEASSAARAAQCAATLAEALGDDLPPLRRALAHPGCASGDLLPPDAPPAEQLAAALRALAMEGRGRVDVSGGRSSSSTSPPDTP